MVLSVKYSLALSVVEKDESIGAALPVGYISGGSMASKLAAVRSQWTDGQEKTEKLQPRCGILHAVQSGLQCEGRSGDMENQY